MSTCLVTGMTSGQTRETNKHGEKTLAGIIAAALRDYGHDVTVGPWQVAEDHSSDEVEYDWAWIGIGPVKGLATSYKYCALDALHHYWNKCTLYVDDTETARMGAELRAALASPEKFVKPFWSYKRGWAVAHRQPVLGRLLGTVDALLGSAGKRPSLLTPAWNRDFAFTVGNGLSPMVGPVARGLDVSSVFEIADPGKPVEKSKTATSGVPEERYWATTLRTDSPEVTERGIEKWGVERFSWTSWSVLRGASGVIVPASAWSPELSVAIDSGIPVACDWKTMGPVFGPPFEALPANIEAMPNSDRAWLARAQSESYSALRPSRAEVHRAIAEMTAVTGEKPLDP